MPASRCPHNLRTRHPADRITREPPPTRGSPRSVSPCLCVTEPVPCPRPAARTADRGRLPAAQRRVRGARRRGAVWKSAPVPGAPMVNERAAAVGRSASSLPRQLHEWFNGSEQ